MKNDINSAEISAAPKSGTKGKETSQGGTATSAGLDRLAKYRMGGAGKNKEGESISSPDKVSNEGDDEDDEDSNDISLEEQQRMGIYLNKQIIQKSIVGRRITMILTILMLILLLSCYFIIAYLLSN